MSNLQDYLGANEKPTNLTYDPVRNKDDDLVHYTAV